MTSVTFGSFDAVRCLPNGSRGRFMDYEAIAVDALRREIAKRLRSVCSHIPASQFDQYVERLAYVERSYQVADHLESLDPKQIRGDSPG